MGNSETTRQPAVLNPGGRGGQYKREGVANGGVGVSSGLSDPNDRYTGPATQHSLASFIVRFHYKKSESSEYMGGAKMVTSEMDNYYSQLQQFYTDGMRMSEFIPLPSVLLRYYGYVPNTKQWFQGIFYRDNAKPPEERWLLLIEQMVLQAKEDHVSMGGFEGYQTTTTSDLSGLYQMINGQSARGARFIGVQETGTQQGRYHGGSSRTHSSIVVGFDVFFELPQHPVKEIYIYNFVQTPIPVEIFRTCNTEKRYCDFDWARQVHAFLSKGWRLVSAFIDKTNRQMTPRKGCGIPEEVTESCVWTFEKPTSRQQDETPVYESKVVEFPYYSPSQAKSPEAKWDPIIVELSQKGWELACILATPGMDSARTFTYIFFFQRLIM